MAVSKWFDYKLYLNNKLAQLEKTDPDGQWDMTKLMKTLSDADFKGEEGAERHFVQYGQYEGLSPNAFFNVEEYYRAKAVQATGKTDAELDAVDIASIKLAIKDADMSAWSHYEGHGSAEGVNPSNSFNTTAYLEAKLEALKTSEPTAGWDMAKLNQALKDAGLSALEHFMIYAGTPGEVTEGLVDGKIPAKFAVDPKNQVTPDGGDGHFIELTTKIDNLKGTAGNDVFVGTAATTQTMDSINGNGGDDILRLDNVTNLPGVIKGVQTFSFENNATQLTHDLSGYADLKHVAVKNAQDTVTLTLGKGVDVNLAGIANEAMNVTFDKADTTAKIGLENITDSSTTAVLTVSGAGLESLTLNTSGKDSSLHSLVTTGTKISTLTVTGDKNLTIKDTALDNAITTIKADTFKGDLDLAVGNGKMNIMGGEGDDTFRFGATLTKDDVIDGGAGMNTLSANGATLAAITATDKHVIKNIQTLAVANSVGTGPTVVNASVFGDITNVIIADQVTSSGAVALTFNKIAAAADDAANVFTFEGDLGASTGNIAFNITDAKNAGVHNEAVLVMKGGALTATSSIQLDGVEDVTIDVSDATGKQTFNLKDTSLTTLTVVGDQAVDLSQATLDSTLVNTVDARGLSGTFDIKLNASAAVGAVLYGGSGVNTMTGSAQNDVFHAGAKGDTLTGGGGADVYYGGTGVDTFKVDVVKDATTITANTIHDFQKGASADVLGLSLADIQALTAVTQLTNGNSAALSDGDTVGVKVISGQTTVAATDNVFALAGTFADADAVEAAIVAGGTHQVTLGNTSTAKDGHLFVYSDGTNAWLAVAHDSATGTTLGASTTVVENLVQLAGIGSIADGDFAAGNFDFLA